MSKIVVAPISDHATHRLPISFFFGPAEWKGLKQTTISTIDDFTWGKLVECYGSPGVHDFVNVDVTNEPALKLAKTSKFDMWCPAEFTAGAELKGDHVLRVHVLSLDFDGKDKEGLTTAEKDAVLALCDSLEYVLHTSFSHGRCKEGRHKFRIIFLLSRPVENTEWANFWPRAADLFGGGHADPACPAISHRYFEPSGPLADREKHYARHHAGEPLPVDDVLSLPMPEKSEIAPAGVETTTAVHLESLAKKLGKRSTPHAMAMSRALRNVLAGKPYAEKGERERHLFLLVGEIIRAYPHADPEPIVSLFATSHSLMGTIQPGTTNGELTLEKIARAKKSLAEEAEKAAAAKADDITWNIRTAFGGGRDIPYTTEERVTFANAAGVSGADLTRQMLVKTPGDSYYVFLAGAYTGPYRNPIDHARQNLAAAVTWGVDVYRATPNGESRLKSASELMEDYGTAAEKAQYDLTADRHYYDHARKTLILAPYPLRADLKPRDATEAQLAYLRNLCGGDDETFSLLLDWLACAPELNKMLPLLYMTGKSQVGKSWLPTLLSRLWGKDSYTRMENALSRFNGAILDCPVLFGDETISCTPARFRDHLTLRAQKIERKGFEVVEALGCVRNIVADNLGTLLRKRDDDADEDSVAGTASRILMLHAPRTAKEFTHAETDAWDRDWLASFCLHLAATREVVPGTRFACRTKEGAVKNRMIREGGLSSIIYEHIVKCIMDPTKMRHFEPGVRVEDGEVWVSSTLIQSQWKLYGVFSFEPKLPQLTKELGFICEKADRGKRLAPVHGKGKDSKREHWRVRLDDLKAAAFAMGFVEEEISSALGTDSGTKAA